MAKPRPHRPPRPAPVAVHPLLRGHDLTTAEGEEAARRGLYRWLGGRARWIDLCEAEARRALGQATDDDGEIPEEAFVAASHRLMRAGVEPPEGLDPGWFPPEVHAMIIEQDGVKRRRRPRPTSQSRGTSRHMRNG